MDMDMDMEGEGGRERISKRQAQHAVLILQGLNEP